MRGSIPALHRIFVLAGMASAACTSPSDRRNAAATASSHADSQAMVRTAAVSSDTSTPSPAAPAPAAAPTPASQGESPRYDAASNTVTFDLVGGPSGFQFNGYASGGATLTVPSNAKIVMNFVNKDGTPHSAEVISGDGPLPNTGIEPAIPKAYTKDLVAGLPQGGTDVMNFTAPAGGTYRIICGVPGHALSGMWIWFKVDPAAKAPSFGPTKKP